MKRLLIFAFAVLILFGCEQSATDDAGAGVQTELTQNEAHERGGQPEEPMPPAKDPAEEPVEEQKEEEQQKPAEPKQEDPAEEPQKPVTIDKADYEIRQIHKGSDSSSTHYIIVFIGDGFTRKEWYSEENKHKTFYGHIDFVKAVLFGGTVEGYNLPFDGMEPFKSYKAYIDIYAIATVSNSKTNTYLQNTGTGFTPDGETRLDLLLNELKKEHNASPNAMHTLINSDHQGSYGRAFFNKRSFSNTFNANATIHEMCHSIGGLGDEKGNALVAANVPNISKAKDNVPWEPIIGFNNITVVQAVKIYMPTTVDNTNTSGDCIMGLNTDKGYLCEVCKYALAVKMSSVIAGCDIKMYDEQYFDKVIRYDTYEALKEHLVSKSRQDEQAANIKDLGSGTYRIFAKGISESRYYDANKSGGDTSLCWAAASSNLIAWWQDLYEKGGKLLPDTVTCRSEEDIFSLFKRYNQGQYGDGNVTGTFLNGVPWYFIGDQSGDGGAKGGYLLSLYIGSVQWIPINPKAYSYFDEAKLNTLVAFSAAVIDGLKKGAAAGLKLHGSYDHAITLWGADVSGNTVIAVHITDSDDGIRQMQTCKIEHDGTNVTIGGSSFNGCSRITGLMFLYAPN